MASSKQFKASIVLGGAVASSLKSAFGTTEGGLKRIGKEIQSLTGRQKLLGSAIQKFGRMGEDVTRMRGRYSQLTQQVDRLRASQMRLNAQQARYAKLSSVGGKLRGAGYAMGVGAAVIGAPILSTLKESKAFALEQTRIAALGLGDKATASAVKFATGMKTIGTSITENLTLMRDGMSVFGDEHHAELAAPTLAKMKFANAALYGKEHGEENDAKFYDMLKVVELRGGIKSQADFAKQANFIQKVISSTGGRVGPDEWRNLIKTGGIAAKGTRDDAFYYQLEPLVQEMGGDKVGTGLSAAYGNLYQGRTSVRAARNLDKLGLIADRSKVSNDKSGQLSHLNPGALKGSEIFRQSQYEWMKQVLLPALAAKGMTTKDQVLDAIGSIFTNRKGADVMSAMYLQMQQIDKSEKLNRGAADIDKLTNLAKNSTQGKEVIAEAKLANLKLRMGQDIMPLYTKALELGTVALESLNGFMERHRGLSKMMSVGLGVLAAGLGVLAPALITVGFVLTPLAKGFGLVTNAVRFFGRAVLSNPIVVLGAAIAFVAVEIYRHWDGFKAFFVRLWGDIKNIFGGELEFIRGAFTGNFQMMIDGVEKMFKGLGSFVKDIFDGIANGIGTMVEDALDAMGIIDKAKSERERKSLEDMTPEQRAQVKKNFNPFAVTADTSWSDFLDKPAPSIPPMATARAGAQAAAAQPAAVYHITQQPGESGEQLARRIDALQQKRTGVQQRGQMFDAVGG